MKSQTPLPLVSLTWIVILFLQALQGGASVIGSWENKLEGPLPVQNLICCQDTLQCSDGDETYQNCRMPDATETNLKLCNFGAGDDEYPYVCDACPGGVGDHCDGSGWAEVGDGEFQCDGPVYRGEPASVRQVADEVWYIFGAGGVFDPTQPLHTTECNNSYSHCQDATCYEPDCMPCSDVLNPWANGACPNERGAMCHRGELQGTNVYLCCNGNQCIRPNAATGDCTGHVTYELTYSELATCEACPTPDLPDVEEVCHGWDLGNDSWGRGSEELLSSLNCSQEDEAACKVAIYVCDGRRVSINGVELNNGCLSNACDGI